MEMQAVQIVVVTGLSYYMGHPRDLIMTEASQNGCEEGQCIVTMFCCTIGALPVNISPPPLLTFSP